MRNSSAAYTLLLGCLHAADGLQIARLHTPRTRARKLARACNAQTCDLPAAAAADGESDRIIAQ
eukprot:5330650-Lingulodinium_polyedra.AAC.1